MKERLFVVNIQRYGNRDRHVCRGTQKLKRKEADLRPG